jgi:hypothetical protein
MSKYPIHTPLGDCVLNNKGQETINFKMFEGPAFILTLDLNDVHKNQLIVLGSSVLSVKGDYPHLVLDKDTIRQLLIVLESWLACGKLSGEDNV